MFALALPFNGQQATWGNGAMVGFNLGDATEVKRLYIKALAIGGTDEGSPGIRSGHFCAYVRDLDNLDANNKICLFE